MRALLSSVQSNLFIPGTMENRGRSKTRRRYGAYRFTISLAKIAAKRMRDQSVNTDGAGVPNFNITEGLTVAASAATGGTIGTHRFAIDEQDKPPSTTVEGCGLGIDFLATDHNHINDATDTTDASNATHTLDGHNLLNPNSASDHVGPDQRNDTGGYQCPQDTLLERATKGRGQTYHEGLPWPSKIVTSANNW